MKNKKEENIRNSEKINVKLKVHEKGIYFHSFDVGELNNFNEDAGKELKK